MTPSRSGATVRTPTAACREPAAGSATGAPPPGCLWAGVGRSDITDYEAGPVNDPLYAKALVLRSAETSVAVVTVDAVALAEIGPIPGSFLGTLREALWRDLGIAPGCVLVNSSHCHGSARADAAQQAIAAVKAAWAGLMPVAVGAGVGHEDRISENRRLRRRDGREADVRHAYALVPDEDVAAVGPIDPRIGVLRLDRLDGRPLAVLYTFACHPIQGVPSGANTADITGFASAAVEGAFGDGAMALFLQGCAGDINPVGYKDISHPRDAAPLGAMLGVSVLQAAAGIECRAGAALKVVRQALSLPRGDLAPAMAALAAEEARLAGAFVGTSLNLKGFLHLAAVSGLAPQYPSADRCRYLHEQALGREALSSLDARNRRNMEQYAANIRTMEALTRVRENLRLLRMHHEQNLAAGGPTLEVELLGLRVGDFVLTTFPGELSVQIGLDLSRQSPHPFSFVAGYTNGYIYYAPTAEQLRNRGWAQEDSDCLLAPEWQAVYESAASAILRTL